MAELRDYEKWHEEYDDPNSDLSERLKVIQGYLHDALNRREGPIRLLSCCAGDGRDVIGVLSQRRDSGRVRATLVELHPRIAQRARTAADGLGSGQVEVRLADAGNTDAYVDAAPADVVVLVGVFGNITSADQARTISNLAPLCRPAAQVIWSLGGHHDTRSDELRRLFVEAGFTEVRHDGLSTATRGNVGVVRYDGPPRALVPGQRLFTFVR